MKGAIVGLVFIVFAIDCSAQSIADVARKERERQRRLHSTVVITSGPTVSTVGQTASTAAGTSSTAVPAPTSVKPVELTDNQGHNEKYWRDLFQKARDAVKRADDKVQLLDLKLKDLNTGYLTRSDIYNRENRLGPQITQTQKELDDARKESDQAKQKLSDLEDDLRKAGGPAGWAR
jgi:peptidoglycan hydrolase CwlO-like protein